MLAALLLLLGSVSLAQEDPFAPVDVAIDRGKELYENGVILYKEGRYEQAISAWREGHALTSKPGFLFNIANAFERMADYDEALKALAEYRAFARAEDRPTLDRRLRALEARRDEAEAQSQTNTRTQGGSGEALPPNRPGLAPASRLALMGVGLAGIGTGVGFGLASRSSATDASASCAAGPRGTLCADTAQRALARSRRQAAAADVSFVAGGALTLTMLGVTLLQPKGRDRGASVGLGGAAGSVTVAYTWTGL